MKKVRRTLLTLLTLFTSANLAAEEISMFATADKCLACHNKLTTSHGENVSIGTSWAASMMANSARDPYWQASVRREVLEHPESKALIEDTCASCHMPMSRFLAKREGKQGTVFEQLSAGAELAMDGVSCNLCHQIEADHFGERESFNAGFVISEELVNGKRPSYGPYPPTEKVIRAMERITDYVPVESAHIQESEMCATCHTLYTPTLNQAGEVVGSLPEQMPYLEWRHSEFAAEQSCQSCHMPVVDEEIRLGLGGEPRSGMSRHQFRGGNAFMLSILAKHAEELGVKADPEDLEHAAKVTRDHLASDAAEIRVDAVGVTEGTLSADITVRNLGGHKLPTAYPSRRAWLHVSVRDATGAVVFESGAVRADGSIAGNANDEDRTTFEPHYEVIGDPGEVQIYESILVDDHDEVTTALLRAIRYVKDNRLLPRGFDKTTAGDDIAVRGAAMEDADFLGGTDTIRLAVDTEGSEGPFTVDVELLYQPIAFRWARNLALQSAPEIDRFIRIYDANAKDSSALLAKVSATTK